MYRLTTLADDTLADNAAPHADNRAANDRAANDRTVSRAMTYFWREGFYASAVDDIVAETGLDRNRLYTDFGGRQGLFVAALKRYVDEIVMYGFRKVETDTADARAVAGYFTAQATKAIETGLPGMGCFIYNTVSKTPPGNRAVRDVTDACVSRLHRGFENALAREARARGLDDAPVRQLAAFLATASLGFWIHAGHTDDPADLWKYRRAVLDIMEEKFLLSAGAAELSRGLNMPPLQKARSGR